MNEEGRVRTGLLLAAHGERGGSGKNESVYDIAETLKNRAIVDVVEAGFISGTPAIAKAVQTINVRRLLVYPLFMSDGYFVQVRLQQLLDEALKPLPVRPEISLLRPLGLEPALATLITERVRKAAASEGWPDKQVTAVLLAHGSTQSEASRKACEALCGRIMRSAAFAAVRTAYLEESPSLGETVASITGPSVVVGLFVGEGRHGGEDVQRHVAELRRTDVILAGNLGNWPEVSDIVADACAGFFACRTLRR